ncbi:hexose kinase [Agromyces sp. SYSU K20354]|uniref:1-phosphofructokinase family hexose kinase n=1 Tax=Agromyces cavernae TaxID=2898659 RepID=UPI001E45919F|nr:hexose kinase [Agromyces cavernae]MCD2441765.1 hexose kinase [Agromyces cavernae]
MILTVTPNPAEDLTWHVDRLRPGDTHRVDAGASRAGGKGINVARVLAAEGHDVLALSTAGGATGAGLAEDLERSGLRHVLVPVAGETRRSIAIVDEASGDTSIFNERGADLSPVEAADLLAEAARLGRAAAVAVISGSLPPGLEPDAVAALVAELIAAGVAVVVDTSGPGLLAAARAGATVLKPNRDELAAVTGESDPVAGARVLLDAGASVVVVSLGAEGLLVLDATDAARGIRARLPKPLHGNATGAGDAAVAAIAAALAEHPELRAPGGGPDDPDTTSARIAMARRATAWSASAVLMPLAGALSPEHAALEADVVVTTLESQESA